MKKDIRKVFQDNELRITIEANKKVVNFLDVTFDLNSGQHIQYVKPNNTLQKYPSRNQQTAIRNILQRRSIQQSHTCLPESPRRQRLQL